MRRNGLTKIVRSHALQALFPLRQGLRPAQELLRKFRSLGLPPLLFPALQVGRIGGGGVSGCSWCCVTWGFLPSRSTSVYREGRSVSGRSSVAPERASVSSAPSGAGEGEVACLQRTPPARSASSVASSRSSQHARRCDESGEVSEGRSFSRSSRVSRSSDRGTRKDRRAHSQSDSSRDCGRCSLSRAPRAVAIFGLLPLPVRTLSLSGRPVSILGSIPVSPSLLTTTDHIDSVLLLTGELAVTRAPSSSS